LLSCAGSFADPPLSTDGSNAESGRVEESEFTESPKRDTSGAAVIATLRTRDSELTILSAGGAMRYALVDAAGEEKNLTLDQLRAYDPNLFEVVTAAMARRAAGSQVPESASVVAGERRRPGGEAFVDASLDRAVRPNAAASSEVRAERGLLGLPRHAGAVLHD
jgi:hypothetical protein